MNILKIKGIIARRILINYQIDKEVLERYLSNPFRPKLVNGKGIAGICLIRLKEIRPKGLPKKMGISSENGAHRIAVEWSENEKRKEGLYIPRRDSSSKLNALAGGAIFPGIQHLADFKVLDKDGFYDVAFLSDDKTALSIKAKETNSWNSESVFKDLKSVSNFFFKNGAVGDSPKKNGFNGLELNAHTWNVSLLNVEFVT